MNDLESLRGALRTPPPDGFAPVDVQRVMALGGRMRTRRRALRASAVLGVTAAVLISVSTISQQQSTPPAAPVLLSQSHPADPGSTTVSDVVETGLRDDRGQVLLYFVSGDYRVKNSINAAQRYSGYGLTLAHRDGQGRITADTTSNASFTEGVFDLCQNEERGLATYGIYTGPAARIVAKLDEGEVTAHTTTWSTDRTVVLYWFDPDTAPKFARSGTLTLSALDAEGRPLAK
ncbi:hypothetical protein GCM10010174_79900 [Kutzneria viridogrisea]|uniref:Uncharacterized protein n=2 Tax=Kutzneria TaxID=43356 RepID=W5WBN6_9PSEU|nr:hypothetical protein [Kutzneria albida]AHH98155.1 hypothetical protein KALB_4793 [Kutzneria albida DSM 43870]MBA8924162.1 hypothetical protein [Kutzneria viridogrisea]